MITPWFHPGADPEGAEKFWREPNFAPNLQHMNILEVIVQYLSTWDGWLQNFYLKKTKRVWEAAAPLAPFKSARATKIATWSRQDPTKVTPRSREDPAKIAPRTDQDPAEISSRSRHNPISIAILSIAAWLFYFVMFNLCLKSCLFQVELLKNVVL